MIDIGKTRSIYDYRIITCLFEHRNSTKNQALHQTHSYELAVQYEERLTYKIETLKM